MDEGYSCSFLCKAAVSVDFLCVFSEHEDSWVSKAAKYFALREVNTG